MNGMLKDFSKEKFDILIQAGQSNSEGYGFGIVSDPYVVNDRVWYFNGDGTFQIAQEKVQKNGIQSNFALSFARKYIEEGMLDDDRKLLILRTAVGGTGFSDNRWKSTDDLYLRMMNMVKTVLELNPENRLKALLWHQGETDAMNQVTFEYYHEHITALVNQVRTVFSVPTLPFIAGDFVPLWKSQNEEKCVPVIDALKNVCKQEYSAFVETAGLDSNFEDDSPHPLGWSRDDAHFCRRAIYRLGERYFRAYRSILKPE